MYVILDFNTHARYKLKIKLKKNFNEKDNNFLL